MKVCYACGFTEFSIQSSRMTTTYICLNCGHKEEIKSLPQKEAANKKIGSNQDFGSVIPKQKIENKTSQYLYQIFNWSKSKVEFEEIEIEMLQKVWKLLWYATKDMPKDLEFGIFEIWLGYENEVPYASRVYLDNLIEMVYNRLERRYK